MCVKVRCNGDSLRSASVRGKWSFPAATAALSTYSLTRIARPRVENRGALLSCCRPLTRSSTYQLVNYLRYNEPLRNSCKVSGTRAVSYLAKWRGLCGCNPAIPTNFMDVTIAGHPISRHGFPNHTFYSLFIAADVNTVYKSSKKPTRHPDTFCCHFLTVCSRKFTLWIFFINPLPLKSTMPWSVLPVDEIVKCNQPL